MQQKKKKRQILQGKIHERRSRCRIEGAFMYVHVPKISIPNDILHA